MQIPYILTNSTVTVVAKGQSYSANNTHPKFADIIEVLKCDGDDIDALIELFDFSTTISGYISDAGNVKVDHGLVKYKDQPLDLYVTNKILEFKNLNLPIKPLLNFIDRLMANPSRRAVTELYLFLEHKNMPITPDGHFLAYKGVASDYMDSYTHTFDNHIGQTLEMTRWQVCDDADVGCSHGFHAGTYEYANDYAGSKGHLMIVKIDPADVVSIPKDHNCQKLRTCKYVVVDEVLDRKPIEKVYVDNSYNDVDDNFSEEFEDSNDDSEDYEDNDDDESLEIADDDNSENDEYNNPDRSNG